MLEEHPTPSPATPSERIDLLELERAWHLLRVASMRFDLIAREAAGLVPFALPRVLILSRLARATPYGLSARQLASLLRVRPSTLGYHLDGLEDAGLVTRTEWTLHDRRKVAVRLTAAGRHAADRFAAQPPMRSPAIANP